jgi:hypothetical protein
VFERPVWYQNGAWLVPMFVAGVVALVLTALLWPITVIVRRRFGGTLALDPKALRAYRWSKIASVVILAGLITWGLTLAMMLKDINNLSAKFDSTVRFAQVVGILAFIGGFGLMLWNLFTVWSGTRRWPAKLWSVVLVFASFMVLWVAFAFHLIGFGLNY